MDSRFYRGGKNGWGMDERHYFFGDIVREGILFYYLSGYKLNGPKIPDDPTAFKEQAQVFFDQRFQDSLGMLDGAHFLISRSSYNLAAFAMHQAVESVYVKARYSPYYTITKDQLLWLADCVKFLQEIVNDTCSEKLA